MAKLLVTGGAGFIGSHFTRAWRASHPEDDLVVLDLLTYAGSRERLADLSGADSFRFIQGDICDPKAVTRALDGVTLVAHFAAETHVDRSIMDAQPFLRTNIEGTYTLLQAAQTAGVQRFLHVSTDEVYGPILEGAVDEQAPFSPRSPYAASKAAGDLLVGAYHHTHQLPVVTARPTNIYGPAQFLEKFIPLIVTNILDGQTVPIYGDGQQRRAWLFVEDACRALQRVLERGEVGQSYNIGSGHEQANAETAKQVLTLMGASEDRLQFVTDRPAHDRRYAMQDGKVKALGWRPETSFAGLAQGRGNANDDRVHGRQRGKRGRRLEPPGPAQGPQLLT